LERGRLVKDFEQALEGYLGVANLRKIRQVKVGIAGAGGLGSNCLLYLVRSGFCRFKICDFDRVEASNLNRQFYFCHQIGQPKVLALKDNVLQINPHIEVEAVQERVTTGNVDRIFADCDVVVEAFDGVVNKKLLVETYYASGKLLVAASGVAGWGNSDLIKVTKIHDRFYLVGDQVSEVSETMPPMAPRVNIVAAKQADLILSYVLNGCGRF
jgi:sulfur carrier protein ThiS adenylyltransferase